MKNSKKLIDIVVIILFISITLVLLFTFRNNEIFRYISSGFLNVLKLSFSVYLVIIGIFIFLENKNPSRTLSWLLVLYLFPVGGFIFYLIFGKNMHKKRWASKKKSHSLDRRKKMANIQRSIIDYIDLFTNSESLVNNRLINLLLKNSDSPFFVNNKLEILNDGESTFSSLIDAISDAKDHIHLEYFIIRNDNIGNRIKNLLIEKAQNGIEVRLIYDSVGCWKLSKKYLEDLKNAGVKVRPFFPVYFPLLRRELNYRNHRKIVVVDGHTSFVGGLNIGDEYLGHNKNLGFWRDTHLKIIGEASYGLQNIFISDWEYVSEETLNHNKYFPKINTVGNKIIQIAASGPDSDWETIMQAYFTMVSTAEKRLWITTPYLVPEESIIMGLKTAALSGIDVRIIIPSKADHFLVYWASRANIEELLKAGVRIYTYKNGFIHSKILLVDGISASVGTANLDIRSLEINFEVNAFIYDTDAVLMLEEQFKKDLKLSEELDLEGFQSRGLLNKTLEAFGRLVSPLQ